MKPRPILTVALFFAMGVAANASTFSNPYSSFWALGDSLTDNGNAFALAPDRIPSPPYFEGRVSNGPTYAEYLAADFEAQGKPTGNLAIAGARAVTDPDGPARDLQVQAFSEVPVYADGSAGLVTRVADFGERPLVSMFFGSNDVLDAFSPGGNPPQAAISAAQEVLGAMGMLTGFGVRDFLVFGLPDFAQTPAFNTQPEFVRQAASGSALAFDATLAAGIELLPDGVQVTQVDVFSALRGFVANPEQSGLSNVDDACLTQGLTSDGAPKLLVCEDPNTFAFYDDIHPTGTVHMALAEVAREAVAPIPLPAAGWALLLALASLSGMKLLKRGI